LTVAILKSLLLESGAVKVRFLASLTLMESVTLGDKISSIWHQIELI